MADPGLRVVQDSWEHLLSVVFRFDDHFLGVPVAEELQVTLTAPTGRWLLPVRSQASTYRNADGTYRFADVGDGNYPVSYSSPSGDWTSWDPALTVALPIAGNDKLMVRQLWPTSQSATPAGMTVIRGKLIGTDIVGAMAQIAPHGGPFDSHFNRADGFGNFFYPFLQPAVPQTDGRIQLTAQVDGGARVVVSTNVIEGSTVTHTLGPDFLVYPGRATRVKFNVT